MNSLPNYALSQNERFISSLVRRTPLFCCFYLSLLAPLFADDEELPRRSFFGAHLAPLSKEIRIRENIEADEGVLLQKVFPDSPATDAELRDGDIVLRADGDSVADIDTFLERVSAARAGETWALEIVRAGVVLEKEIELEEFPRFRDDYFHLDYGHVVSRGARLRTLLTCPKTDGPHPAVLLLQGGGNFSIDNPRGPATSFTRIARHLSRNGYVTMRVDRRGCGDSEGASVRDMDFLTELDGYRQALAALRKFDFVDQSKVFIFGHSLGGVTGPILASETPVRGIASYGTISGMQFERIMAQRRSFATLDGTDSVDVEKRIEREMQFWYPLLVEKLTPKEIRAKGPEVAKTMDELGISHPYIFYRPYTWLHQASEVNLGEVWTKVASTPLEIAGQDPVFPRVLSLWGTSDWVCEKKPILWINEIVNRARPGSGKFIAIDSSDHFFFSAESFQESYGYFKPPPRGPYGEFNPSILKTLRNWLEETANTAEPSRLVTCRMKSPTLHTATLEDAEMIAKIYNHYVEHTTVTFEEQSITESEMRDRMGKVLAILPWIVAEDQGRVIGCAYASKWNERSAYRFSVQSSVYLDPDEVGRCVGSQLYEALLGKLRDLELHCVLAGIALPNEPSVALHKKFGFREVGRHFEVGWKKERWLDVGYWQLLL